MACDSQYSAIKRLNDDCLSQIFKHSSVTDRFNIEKVCKNWHRVMSTIWKTFNIFDITQEDLRISKGCFHCEVNLPICQDIFTRFGHQLKEINLSGTLTEVNKSLMDSKVSIRFVQGENFKRTSKNLRKLLLNCDNIETLILSSDVISVNKAYLSKLFGKNKKIRSLELEGYDFTGGHPFILNHDNLESLWVSDGTIDLQFLNLEGTSVSSKIRKLCLGGNVWTRKSLEESHLLLPLDLEQLCILLPDEIVSYFRIISDLPKLQNLRILKMEGYDEMNDDVVEAISLECIELVAINIAGSRNVSDKGIRSLSRLQKLTCLDISSGSRYTDEALEYLGKNLRVLEIKGNNFTDVGASALVRKLQNLEILDLDENKGITDEFVVSAINIVKSRKNEVALKIGLYDTQVNAGRVFELCPLLELHIKYPIHPDIHYSEFITL